MVVVLGPLRWWPHFRQNLRREGPGGQTVYSLAGVCQCEIIDHHRGTKLKPRHEFQCGYNPMGFIRTFLKNWALLSMDRTGFWHHFAMAWNAGKRRVTGRSAKLVATQAESSNTWVSSGIIHVKIFIIFIAFKN